MKSAAVRRSTLEEDHPCPRACGWLNVLGVLQFVYTSVFFSPFFDNFTLGFDNGSLGQTRVYVGTVGHTWTLGKAMVLDGNFGVDVQNST